MPVYSYKAVDQNGIIVSNKIQEKSKQGLIKRLKAGGLTPIEVRLLPIVTEIRLRQLLKA